MTRAATVLTCLCGLALVLGFCGAWHPFFDAIAIGRWVAAIGFLAGLTLVALTRGGRVLALAGAIALICVLGVSRLNIAGEAGPVRVYAKNLWYNNAQTADVVADIRDAAPDIVILQEVSATNMRVLSGLRDSHPHQAICPWQGWNGVAILSRWPLADAPARCSPFRSLMAVEVLHPDAPFWAVGVHLQQPWPDVQWDHLSAALPVLDGIDHAIVAGDFNTVPWAAAPMRIGALTNTRAIRTHGPTFSLWGVGLPLDQVWAEGGHAVRRPQLGSDHYGVLADVWPSAVAY